MDFLGGYGGGSKGDERNWMENGSWKGLGRKKGICRRDVGRTVPTEKYWADEASQFSFEAMRKPTVSECAVTAD